MIVFVIERVPKRIRGIISRYCIEVHSNVFVGNVDHRLKEKIWELIEYHSVDVGPVIMIWSDSTNEQGYSIKCIGESNHTPVFRDGLWVVDTQIHV